MLVGAGSPVASETMTLSRSRADAPVCCCAVKEILQKYPGSVTVLAGTVRPYTFVISPAVLSIVPALKNVSYGSKRSPSVTEFA
jgi:hypothetical protein